MSRLAPYLIFLLATTSEPASVLRIRALPQLQVAWQGVPIGATDDAGELVIREIPAGIYTLTFRKEGYREASAQIEIDPGTDTTFSPELEPSTILAQPATETPHQDVQHQDVQHQDVQHQDVQHQDASPGSTPTARPESLPTGQVAPPAAPPAGTPDLSVAPQKPESPLFADDPTRPLLSNERALLLLLLVAAITLLAYKVATARSRARQTPISPGKARFRQDESVDWKTPSPAFIADLSRREQTLDHVGDVDPSTEDIIEVEFTEVRPLENES